MRSNATHHASVCGAVVNPKVDRLVDQVRAQGPTQREPRCRTQSCEGRHQQEPQRQLPRCSHDARSVVWKRVVVFVGQETNTASHFGCTREVKEEAVQQILQNKPRAHSGKERPGVHLSVFDHRSHDRRNPYKGEPGWATCERFGDGRHEDANRTLTRFEGSALD